MKKTKASRLKEGFLYALLYIGFMGIKNLIFDYGETSQLFHELSHAPRYVLGGVTLTILGLWLFIGLLIGGVLIISDASKR